MNSMTTQKCHHSHYFIQAFQGLLSLVLLFSLVLLIFPSVLLTSYATTNTETPVAPITKRITSTNTKKTISRFNLNTEEIQLYFKDAKFQSVATPYNNLKRSIDPVIVKLSKQTKVYEFSIYAKDLSSNVVYTWNADRLASTTTFGHTEAYYKGASVAKLYEVFAVYKLAEAGFLNLDQSIKDPYTGYVFTLRSAISKAIRKSDNDSFCRIVRAVGPENINMVLSQYGIKNNYIYAELGPAKGFSVRNNVVRYKTEKSSRVNPYGAGLILEMVYKEAAAGNLYMKAFKDHLLNNVYTSRIPAALSYKLDVAHKTGTIESEGVYHDAGIVYGPHPYIIVVYTKDAPDKNKAHVFIRGAIRSINKTFISNRVQMDQAFKTHKKTITPTKLPVVPAPPAKDSVLNPIVTTEDASNESSGDIPSEQQPLPNPLDETIQTP